MRYLRWAMLLAVAAALVSTGCAKETPPRVSAAPDVRRPAADPGDATLPIAIASPAAFPPPAALRADRKTREDVRADQALRVVISHMGLDLLRQVRSASPGKNACLSPLSSFSALALVEGGAVGTTREEMRQAMRSSGLEPAAADRAYGRILAGIASDIDQYRQYAEADPGSKTATLTFTIANSLWLDEGVDFSEPFLERARDDYGAQLATMDLADPAAPRAVNRWVWENTGGRIPRVVPEGRSAVEAYLVDALYLRSNWMDAFDVNATHDEPFHVAGGKEATVPLMFRETSGAYAETPVFQAVSLPFQGGSMDVYLPASGKSPDDVLASLATQRDGGATFPSWEERDGRLWLPRFRTDSLYSLKPALQGMGMKAAFAQETADFTAMSPTRPLWIDDVWHATSVSVDENGLEAAAATAIAMVGAGVPEEPKQPFEMRVDRPFVYEIQVGGAPAFIGVVEDPTAAPD